MVGLPSEQWGQKVAAIVVLRPEYRTRGGGRNGDKPWGALDMRRALKDRLAGYKMPQEMKVLEGVIPRNAMGKGEFILSFFSIDLKGYFGCLFTWCDDLLTALVC